MGSTAESQKKRAAGASLITNTTLTAIKLVAAATTGSVSLFSEAAHSATDVVASALAYASVRAASVPPDEEHPYGHGKIESLAGFGESVMLLLIVGYIAFEAVQRLFKPDPVRHLDLGLAVMGVSAAAALGVGAYVQKVGTQTGSIALRSNGQHLMIDFWTCLGVMAALAITRFTSWAHADAVMALLLAAWIAAGAWRMSREAFEQLIDRRISDEDLQKIEAILRSENRLLSWHKLRTRHSGDFHYVDLHVVVPRDWSVVQAHELADSLEKRICAALEPAQVVIHVDPFDPRKADGG